MKEIRLNIPEGCQAVTVKVDGGKVVTEFEPKEGYCWNPDKKELEKLSRWRTKKGEEYFFISEDTLEVYREYEDFDEVDDARHELGNYFKTEEAAERVANQIREIFKNSKAE